MRKLSKLQLAERDRIASILGDLATQIEDKIASLNDEISAVCGDIQVLVEQYNDALTEADGWCTDVVAAMEDYEGERSEKWQDSEAADEFRAWKEEFESVDLEGIEFSEISGAEVPPMTHEDDLLSLPEEKF